MRSSTALAWCVSQPLSVTVDPVLLCVTGSSCSVPEVHASSSAWSVPPNAFLSKGSGRGTHQRIHSAFAGRPTGEGLRLSRPSARPDQGFDARTATLARSETPYDLIRQKAPLVLWTNSKLRLGLPSVPARVARFAGLPQRQVEVPQMELKNADHPGWVQMTRRVCRWTGARIPSFHRTFGQPWLSLGLAELAASSRAPRKITFGQPRPASEVSDSKGFHSGRRGGGKIFRGALKSYQGMQIPHPVREQLRHLVQGIRSGGGMIRKTPATAMVLALFR
jgi:hypothetical protein